MGQTLPNGIYLPAEGERNCYDGLEGNWRSLDSLISTVAGKASATHTHGNISNDGKVGTTANLPLITGTSGTITTGSFGTSANTFCEGNDSRLSDARTPVAHTHTKSDVTDLFNSANTWTGDNKYTSGFILSNISWSGVTPPSSTKPTVIEFKNSDTRQGRYINRISSTSSETWIETIRNVDANTSYNHTVILKVDNSGNKSVYPSSNNDIDLGIAANQWNNLYAKNYYYNGTAWGLDQANVWTNDNTVAKDTSPAVRLKVTNLTRGTPPSVNITADFGVRASNDNVISQLATQITTNGNTYVYSRANDGTRDQRVGIYLDVANNTVTYRTASNGIVHLGDSSYRWKSFNGINPGSLSFPSGGTTENTDWFNVAGDILPTGGNATSFSRATANYFTPAKDGWLSLAVKNCSELSVWCETLKYGISIVAPDASVNRQAVVPVVAGKSYQILIAGNSWVYARLIMPKGNV